MTALGPQMPGAPACRGGIGKTWAGTWYDIVARAESRVKWGFQKAKNDNKQVGQKLNTGMEGSGNRSARR